MSLKEFARTSAATLPTNSLPDWIAAAVKTLIGAGLAWFAVPRIPADVGLVRGWVGMVGIIMMLRIGMGEGKSGREKQEERPAEPKPGESPDPVKDTLNKMKDILTF